MSLAKQSRSRSKHKGLGGTDTGAAVAGLGLVGIVWLLAIFREPNARWRIGAALGSFSAFTAAALVWVFGRGAEQQSRKWLRFPVGIAFLASILLWLRIRDLAGSPRRNRRRA